MSIKTSDLFKFRSCGRVDKKQDLFRVQPGVDLADALNSASDLLDAAYDTLFDVVMNKDQAGGGQTWLVLHAIESAQAVIDALHDAAEDAEIAARKAGGAQ